MTPLESTYKQCVGRQCVGPAHKQRRSTVPMIGRKSEDHANAYLYPTYFTSLHMLSTSH